MIIIFDDWQPRARACNTVQLVRTTFSPTWLLPIFLQRKEYMYNKKLKENKIQQRRATRVHIHSDDRECNQENENSRAQVNSHCKYIYIYIYIHTLYIYIYRYPLYIYTYIFTDIFLYSLTHQTRRNNRRMARHIYSRLILRHVHAGSSESPRRIGLCARVKPKEVYMYIEIK